MKKVSIALALTLMLTLLFAGLASAHVTVQPTSVPANSYQVFNVRVPSEKEEGATTQVKVAIPDGVDVSRVKPKPDWTYELEKNADGKVVSVTWKASGAGLGPTEFDEFQVSGKVAEGATELVWKAYQTYSDGEVVEWTGAPDADKPASVTAVTAATGDAHGAAAGGEAADKDGSRDALTLTLAIVGAAAGVIALGVALARKRK